MMMHKIGVGTTPLVAALAGGIRDAGIRASVTGSFDAVFNGHPHTAR